MTYMELLELWNNGTVETFEDYKKVLKKCHISDAEMDYTDRLVDEGKLEKKFKGEIK